MDLRKSVTYMAKQLRQWTWNFMEHPDDLPYHDYGWWPEPLLHKGELTRELFEHLQGIGKYVTERSRWRPQSGG